jgi:hypothetical protein
MSKTFVYDRYNVKYTNIYQVFPSIGPVPCAGGKFVLAEDAINREAVLQAQIRTLEADNARLGERVNWLDCLEAAGVDNWEGMEEAIRIRREDDC